MDFIWSNFWSQLNCQIMTSSLVRYQVGCRPILASFRGEAPLLPQSLGQCSGGSWEQGLWCQEQGHIEEKLGDLWWPWNHPAEQQVAVSAPILWVLWCFQRSIDWAHDFLPHQDWRRCQDQGGKCENQMNQPTRECQEWCHWLSLFKLV